MDHSAAPLLDALVDYHARDRYGFTPPGHRQGRGADPRTRAALGQDAFRSDVLATAGLDDRTSSHGYLSRAEELMANAVGAEQAFFSTCGSSLSVKAAMLAVAGGQGDLLISRDAHKSVVAGLVFCGVQPQWIRPRYDTRLHLAHPPSPEQVEQAWQEHPDAAGALIVSPTPYGTCADITSIAGLCHRRGKPLIVDEAWGAHLPFHPDLPTWAMDAGADVCVVSVHKMGTGFEQGSVFHRQGDLVDPDQLSACADMLMTTSPNVMVYAALDGWRRQMVEHGHAPARRRAHAWPGRCGPTSTPCPACTSCGRSSSAPRHRTTSIRCTWSSTSPGWASADTTPPTGCASTSAWTWDSATTAGSKPPCRWPTTTRPPPG